MKHYPMLFKEHAIRIDLEKGMINWEIMKITGLLVRDEFRNGVSIRKIWGS
jgi:hypothetical protein